MPQTTEPHPNLQPKTKTKELNAPRHAGGRSVGHVSPEVMDGARLLIVNSRDRLGTGRALVGLLESGVSLEQLQATRDSANIEVCQTRRPTTTPCRHLHGSGPPGTSIDDHANAIELWRQTYPRHNATPQAQDMLNPARYGGTRRPPQRLCALVPARNDVSAYIEKML